MAGAFEARSAQPPLSYLGPLPMTKSERTDVRVDVQP